MCGLVGLRATMRRVEIMFNERGERTSLCCVQVTSDGTVRAAAHVFVCMCVCVCAWVRVRRQKEEQSINGGDRTLDLKRVKLAS